MKQSRTEAAKIINAPAEFLEVTKGMSDTDSCDFMIEYWFQTSRHPEWSYADFLPIWKRWRREAEEKRRQEAHTALEALKGGYDAAKMQRLPA